MEQCVVDESTYVAKVAEKNSCKGCVGEENWVVCGRLGNCCAYLREDKTNIIWIEQE